MMVHFTTQVEVADLQIMMDIIIKVEAVGLQIMVDIIIKVKVVVEAEVGDTVARDTEGAEAEAGVVAEVIVVDEAGWVVEEEGVVETSIGKKSLLSELDRKKYCTTFGIV